MNAPSRECMLQPRMVSMPFWLGIAFGIDNLLDRTYAEHLNLAGSADFGYPADPVRINEPGRTTWLKLTWNMGTR
ncbi:MAG: hypothetical protein C0P74_012175 [Gammaproteobacteria bacterium]